MVDMPREFQAGDEVPASCGEVLVCGCRQEDVAVLEEVFGREGPEVRPVDEPAEMARQAVLHLPLAVFLGLRKRDRARLQIIPLLRAAWRELPVVVVADEASLELERRVRQEGIFYYFVHPLGSAEVEALSRDLLRRAARETTTGPAAGKDVRKKRSEP